MDIQSGRWSTGALMRVIVPIALELALVREVWRIVLIPPVTIGLLAINLGLFFMLVRPRSWQTWILGMLLGGFVGMLVSGFFLALQFGSGPPAVLSNTLLIEAILLDILGIGMIWTGGCMDHVCRR
jgi:hypothetical protein